MRGAVNHFFFHFKTDYLPLKLSYMDESAYLWKQLKWNKFLFHGDRLSGEIVRGDEHRTQRVWKNHLRGTKSPDKAKGCLEKLVCAKDWKTK